MNISEYIPKENGKKKMKKSLLDRIGGQGIGISAKKQQIKTTAKKSFLFFCSSLLIATGLLCPVAIDVSAEAIPTLPNGFNDIDLSDILITFPTGAGAGIKNQTVLSDLYNNYGVSGWGVADMTPYFDIVVSATGESAGLSNDVLNQHLGDNDWFQQNGYDLKVNYDSFKQKLDTTESLTQYGANYIHQATLSPSTGNPWEWDWSSILEEYFKTGLIAFEHVFLDFDTLNNLAVTMDDVLQNVYDFWTPNISTGTGIEININDNLMYTNGGLKYNYLTRTWSGRTFNHKINVYIPNNFNVVYVNQNGVFYIVAHNYNSVTAQFKVETDGAVVTYDIESNANWPVSFWGGSTYIINSTNMEFFDSLNASYTYLNNYDYSNVDVYSPDLINPNGNISIEDYPDMSPSIEQGQAIRPIPQQAYQNWANTNNLQDPAENGALMGALVTPYIQAEPAPEPSPAPDDPWADPVPDTEPANRPVSPTQPDFPDEPELTDEEINESLLGATPDLTEIFPFCIPWDIARILKHFTASRKAPYIEWTLESDLFGFSYTFEIDMSIFDDVAVILRLLELIGFIIGLAILTRYLIGAS